MNAATPPPYPLHAFHLTEERAAREVLQHVQAPDAMIGTAFLTALSVACQGLIDVRLPTGQVRPVSLNTLVIADSGERKTAVDNLVCAPIYASDEKSIQQYEDDLAKYKTEMRFWKAMDAGIRRKITRAVEKGETDE